MNKVVFRNGLRLDGFFCPFCDARYKGVVFRDRFRWMVRMNCGHEKSLGDTLPHEELERRGIINAPMDKLDPRLVARTREAKRIFMLKEFEKIYKLLKGVSHWMDATGGLHTNPCFGKARWEIDAWKKVRMNRQELRFIHEGILRLLDYKKRCSMLSDAEKPLQSIAVSTGGRTVKSSKKLVEEDISDVRTGRQNEMGICVEKQDLYSSTTQEEGT